MRVLVGALILAWCGWQTAHRANDWRSDQALWTAARRTAPDLARPALNLGVAFLKQQAWIDATTQFSAAPQLYSPLLPQVRERAGMGLAYIDAVTGLPICDQPAWRSACVWP